MLNFKGYEIKELHEVGMSDLLALQKAKSEHEVVKILCPGSDNLQSSQVTTMMLLIAHSDAILKGIKSFIEKPYPVPHVILGTAINLPADTKQMPYWPITKAKQIIEAMGDEPFNAYENYVELVGHYVYHIVTSKSYNEYEAESFCKDIAETDFRVIIQMGDFFLYRHRDYWRSKTKSLTMNAMIWKKKLVSMFSINTGTSMS